MNIVGSCHCGSASNSNWNRNKNCGNLQPFALVKKNNNRRRHVQVVGAKEFIEKENERNLLRFRQSVANSHMQDLCLHPVVLQILNCGSVWNQTQISSTPSFPKQIRYNLYVCTICLSTHANLDQYYFRTLSKLMIQNLTSTQQHPFHLQIGSHQIVFCKLNYKKITLWSSLKFQVS
jgi:hypothetical protein